MKKYLFLAIAIYALSGCIGTRRYASYVTKAQYSSDTAAPAPVGGIRLTYEGPNMLQPVVRVTKGQTYFIPAIVYWGTKQTFNCELNQGIGMRTVRRAFAQAAATYHLPEKLHGRTLEIAVDNMPRRFTYTQTVDVLFLLVFYTQSGNQTIAPQADDLRLNYKLYDGGEVAKQGTIEIRNFDANYTDVLRSTKKVTTAYMAQYHKNLHEMATDAVAKLAGEL